MIELIFAFVTTVGPLQMADQSAPVAPTDVQPGNQAISLRKPLINRSPGTRLVLFVRDTTALTGSDVADAKAFERAVPLGSVRGTLRSNGGQTIIYRHTGFTYYRGFSGLVLTESRPSGAQALFHELEIDADLTLPQVRFVWLDRAGRTIRDVPPPR